jgi:DNA-binding HxlR family transcriptional regulator
MKSYDDDFCPHFHHAIELIGRRWTGVVLRTMLHGATRFSDIAAAVPNLSDKMLAERLKELEAEGMITRHVLPVMPVRVEYELTDKGRALNGVVEALGEWADQWIGACPDVSEDREATPRQLARGGEAERSRGREAERRRVGAAESRMGGEQRRRRRGSKRRK